MATRILPWCIVLLLTAAAPAAAQRYPFRTFAEADGMPMSAVTGIAQAADGTLWLAGRGGVAVYDGFAWRSEGAAEGLGPLPLGPVATDAAGVLWVAVLNTPARVYRRDPAGWWRSPVCPTGAWGREVTALAVDGSGQEGATVALAASGTTIHVWHGGAWQDHVLPDGATVNRLDWHAGTLHAATAQGLYTLAKAADGSLRSAVAVGAVPPVPVYASFAADDGGLTVVGRGFIGRLGPAGFDPLVADERIVLPPSYSGVAAARDSLGGLWWGSRTRVFHHHPLAGLEFLDRASGLIANGVSGLVVDREGQVWLAGVRGVSVLGAHTLSSRNRETGLFADEVSAVHELADGSVVLGHEGGLTVVTDSLRSVPLPSPGPVGRVMDLADAGGGDLWAACGTLGLARLDGALQPTWHYVPDDPLASVAAVIVAADGTVWLGCSDGLRRGTGGPGAPFVAVDVTTTEDRAMPSVRRLVEAADGALYAATGRRGVIRVEGGRVTRFAAADEPEANSTFALHPAPDGGWWVGTAAGLRRLGPEGIGPRLPGDPPVDRAVYAITSDGRGTTWFGTDAGVRRWDGATLRAWTVRDGLIGNETNRDAVKLDRRGRLWVGTDRGVTVLDERLAWNGAPAPTARIEGFAVDGRPLAADAPLDLGPEARELVIRLGAGSLADPARVSFRTFLEGFDPRWREAAVLPDRTLRFTKLPPGTYRFRAQAVDAAGRPGPVVTSLPIRVAPPLWRRPPLIALAAAAALGLAWLGFTAATGRSYNRRLRREVDARTAELAASTRAVHRESRRLAVVLGSISDGVVVVGPDGRVSLGNNAAARLLGVAPERLAGRPLEEVLPGMTAMMREARAAQLTGSSSFVGQDAAIPYRVGASGRDLEFAVAPLEDADDRAGGRVLAFRDVTGRRRSEGERMHLRRLESLGLLAGGIAHDFNNLLTVMLGNAAVAREAGGLPAAAAAGLASIEEAAHRARELTSELLTFARGDAPRTVALDLAGAVRETGALVLAGAPLGFAADLPADLRPVEADPAQLSRVLENVLMNARQAMPGGGKVRVSARNVDGAGGEPAVELAIADQGPGIAAADLDRVFEPYFTTKSGGTGLGLAVAHAIVLRHGGRLTVSSQPGRGAVFTVRLPAAVRAPAAAAPGTTGPVSGAAT